MNTDFEYIKKIMDDDGIKAPDSLSEDKILDMLPDLDDSGEGVMSPITDAGSDSRSDNRSHGSNSAADFTRISAPKSKSRVFRRIAAIAACLVIALAGIPGVYNAIVGAPDTSLAGDELYTFSSHGEIKRLVRSMDHSSSFNLFEKAGGAGDMVEDAASEDVLDYEAPQASMDNSASSDVGASHSETYLQVEDVDEADIVKTDGRYIYYVNNKQEVVILSAKDGKTTRLATIGNTGVENYVNDIFLKGDMLVTTGRVYNDDDGYTAIVTYDISDRSRPEMISEFRQTGEIVSSRMVGNYVYLITTDYVYKDGRMIPMCTIDGTYKDIPASDISCIPEPSQTSYVILSAVDISSGKQARSKTKAVFGATDNIYCNDHNLYAAVSEWDWDKSDSSYTRIVRASLDGLKVRFTGTAKVRGYIDDQFSMNEKDGYFYIATTAQRNGMDVNNLFVLDDRMHESGKITGFARNESIRAVRYIGDKAYVITYEAIDPLFVIDLSDPKKPVIEGEVKIDGFSTLLVPISKDRLLGIGHATGDNGYGGEYDAGLKLALFDISDPAHPAVIASKEFEDMDSPAQYTHLALTVNKEEGWFAVPYSIYHYNDVVIDEDVIVDDEDVDEDVEEEFDEDDVIVDNGLEAGVLVFGADDKIHVYDRHKLADTDLTRSVYIDDHIYALDTEGNTYSFKFTR